MDNTLKDDVLEKITDETANQIFDLAPRSRPKSIGLSGAGPQDLVKVMIALQNKFKKRKYFPQISIQDISGYNINVGQYIREFNSQKSS
tara:strand:- start:136 stop:402 length:267 start_codon:yes stop_codon:yes gene_type:complete